MTVAATISEALENIARQGFAQVTVGGQTVTVKSVDELIKADIYLASQNVAAQPHLGLRFTQIVPPGAG